jgi:hypothetical protein
VGERQPDARVVGAHLVVIVGHSLAHEGSSGAERHEGERAWRVTEIEFEASGGVPSTCYVYL